MFANKTDTSGKLTRQKARLVTQRFLQCLSMDYKETFAPVASHTTLRSLLAVVASQHLEYLQIGVKAAFLNEELDETIYMKPHEGFVDPTKQDWLNRLIKSLYGPP